MFELPPNPAAGRIEAISRWLPRIAIALAFLNFGSEKFAGGMWIRIFDQIGLGQWFRYLTGTLQLSGGLLVLIPRTFLVGISLLACTMVGAMLAWIFVLGSPGSALFPGVILLILLTIAWLQH